MRLSRGLCALMLVSVAMAAASAAAETASDFFKGQAMKFTVVYEPGGTYDIYSRLVVTHLPKHLPGSPVITVQYMPGAGGQVGTLNLYDKAPQDGSQIGMVPRDIAVNQVLRPAEAKYDARRFNWVGSVSSFTGVLFVASRTGVKTADDLRRITVVAGSWGKTTESYITPTLLNALGGTQFKIVTGYRGAIDTDLAIERGEVDARVSSWTLLKTQRLAWVRDGFVVVALQTGHKRHPDLPDLPLIADLATSEQGRRIMEFMNSDSTMGWSVVAPPNVPLDRVAVLRRAFDDMVADPEFRADAEKRGLEVASSPGQELEQLVNRTVATPAEALDTLKQIIGGQ